jgi:DNA mismatch repair ATPase MutS
LLIRLGAIATHDIEVSDYKRVSGYFTNKCFEVEIENDELHFDYKLRDGICRNKSATKKWSDLRKEVRS